jgi:CRP/FNR family transcriptional regulator
MMAAEFARLLRRLPIFASLGPEEAVELATRCTGLRYRPGMRIFTEGEFADNVMIIVNGSVQISCAVPDGPDLVIATEGAGVLLGEMALLDPAPRSASATAVEETTVLVMDGQHFHELVAIGHPAATGILRTIGLLTCARMRRLEAQVDQLLTGDPTGDLASRIDTALRGLGP